MDAAGLRQFIYSPYNKVADVKMYFFFAALSPFVLTVMLALVVLSMLIKNFWCRFLCPYGALLGVLSILSPLKITRKSSTCIDCGLCTKACPASIPVHRLGRVRSDECMSCMKCVQVCPVKDTLEMRLRVTGTRVSPVVFGALVAGVFVAVTGMAMITGNWRNSVTQEEYSKRMKEIDKPQYNHFQGRVPAYGPNE
jgi:polyferredoxin